MSPRHRLINTGFSQTVFFLSFLKMQEINKPGQHGVYSWMLYKNRRNREKPGLFWPYSICTSFNKIQMIWQGCSQGAQWESFTRLLSAVSWQTESEQNQVSIYPSSVFLLLNKKLTKIKIMILGNLPSFLWTTKFARTLSGNLGVGSLLCQSLGEQISFLHHGIACIFFFFLM